MTAEVPYWGKIKIEHLGELKMPRMFLYWLILCISFYTDWNRHAWWSRLTATSKLTIHNSPCMETLGKVSTHRSKKNAICITQIVARRSWMQMTMTVKRNDNEKTSNGVGWNIGKRNMCFYAFLFIWQNGRTLNLIYHQAQNFKAGIEWKFELEMLPIQCQN